MSSSNNNNNNNGGGGEGGDARKDLLDTIFEAFGNSENEQQQKSKGEEKSASSSSSSSAQDKDMGQTRAAAAKKGTAAVGGGGGSGGRKHHQRHMRFSDAAKKAQERKMEEQREAFDRTLSADSATDTTTGPVSPLASIVGMYMRQQRVLKHIAESRDSFYERIQPAGRESRKIELSKVMSSSKADPTRSELWSFLESQHDSAAIEETAADKLLETGEALSEEAAAESLADELSTPLQDLLSEAKAMFGAMAEDGKRVKTGAKTRRTMREKRRALAAKKAKTEESKETGAEQEKEEYERWESILERGVANKVYGDMDRYNEAKKEKLRVQFERPNVENMSEEEAEEAIQNLLQSMKTVAANEEKEALWREELKEPALREFLDMHGNNELKSRIENEVEELYRTLSPSEFDSVFQRERVLNARLKEEAMKVLDPVSAERMPIGSANKLDTRTVLNQFDTKALPKYHSYSYLTKIFGKELSAETREEIKAFLEEMDQVQQPGTHMKRGKGASELARMLFLSDKEEKAEISDEKAEKLDLMGNRLQQMKESEDLIEGIRDYVQEMIEYRQAALRVGQGIKTGRRGRSPVVSIPYREEEVILALNRDMDRKFPTFDDPHIRNVIENQVTSVAALDRIDKKMANNERGYLPYMLRQRRKFRTDRRRIAHQRLMNTFKAFTWLQKYGKFV